MWYQPLKISCLWPFLLIPTPGTKIRTDKIPLCVIQSTNHWVIPVPFFSSLIFILFTEITFTHKVFDGPKQHIPAMNRVKKIISESNLTGKVFPLSQGYSIWETDEVIAKELYRNIGLAILCIFIVTLLLFGSFFYSILVLLMVVMSIVDVAGVMHFWGLTIDTISCVNLIIAMGLCVDYSVHVAHWFVGETGDSRYFLFSNRN